MLSSLASRLASSKQVYLHTRRRPSPPRQQVESPQNEEKNWCLMAAAPMITMRNRLLVEAVESRGPARCCRGSAAHESFRNSCRNAQLNKWHEKRAREVSPLGFFIFFFFFFQNCGFWRWAHFMFGKLIIYHSLFIHCYCCNICAYVTLRFL